MRLIGTVLCLLVLTVAWVEGGGYPVPSSAPQAVLAQSDEDNAEIPEIRRRIVVDKSTNRMFVLRGDQLEAVFPVATGKTKDLTPEGRFKVVVKGRQPDWYNKASGKIIPGGTPENPLGSRWIGLAVPGTNGYLYGIHGTNREETVGSYLTAGCIRLNNQNVEWLFDRIPKGTEVLVYSSGERLAEGGG